MLYRLATNDEIDAMSYDQFVAAFPGAVVRDAQAEDDVRRWQKVREAIPADVNWATWRECAGEIAAEGYGGWELIADVAYTIAAALEKEAQHDKG